MFCKYCGNELSSDTRFCPMCGKKIESEIKTGNSAIRKVSGTENMPLDHEVLVMYLYQLQVMEFSVNKLSQDLYSLNQQISSLGHSRRPSQPYSDSIDLSAVGAFLFLGALLAICGSFLYNLIPVGLFSFAQTVGIIIIVGTILIAVISASSKASKNDERRLEYKRQLEQDEQRVRHEVEQRDALINLKPEYVARLDEAKSILARAYSVNIIPEQFRSIYAIYYLYSYLSTSQSTLESAMLHFDLNEIKAKLDTIIIQQRQIILQNAQKLAQNSTIIEQNEELLQRAIATERNTARAAQYAEIAATNTEVTAFTNTIMASIMVSKL